MDPRYECDAPRFVDFELLKQGLADDQDADLWFENKDNHAGLFSAQKAVIEMEEGPSEALEETGRSVFGKELTKTGPGTIYDKMEKLEKVKEVTKTKPKTTKTIYDEMEKLKKAKMQKKEPRIQRRRDAAVKATKSISLMMKAKSRRPAMLNATDTQTTTPNLLKRYQTKMAEKPQLKSSEDREIEKILELRRERQKKVELSQKSFRRLVSKKPNPLPVRSIRPPTEPAEFQFHTDERKKGKPPTPTRSCSEQAAVKFPYNLRNWDKNEWHPLEKRTPTPSGVTKVQPFNLYTDQRFRNKTEQSANRGKFVSSAEFIDKFQKTTPPRFRTKIKDDIASQSQGGGGASHSASVNVTIPKTPTLRSRLRTRPVKVLSHAQQEELELEEMKKYQFKAQPLNKDMLQYPQNLGVPPRTTFQPLTKAQSPHLATKERMQLRRSQEVTEETPSFTFKAHPLPKDILGGVQGVPLKRQHELTNPSSPAITKRRRVDSVVDEDERGEKSFEPIKANPVPDFSSFFQPILPHQHTDAKPFTFEGKYPSKDELVRNLVKQEEERIAKMSEFTANPLPNMSDTPRLPPRPPTTTTKTEPFALKTEDRVQLHLARFNEEVAQKEEKLIKEAKFKATEPASLHCKPFEPLKSDKPLTEVMNINFHSDIRLEQRAKFVAELKEKEAMKERDLAERRAMRESEEAKELKKLRQSLVHKPIPIKDFHPIQIQRSTKPTTRPLSPVLITQTRLRAQNKQNL